MTATTPPDPHPDSPPRGPSDAPDQLTPEAEPERENVQHLPEEPDEEAQAENIALEGPGVPASLETKGCDPSQAKRIRL